MSVQVMQAADQLTVFLPNYNHAHYLPVALDALLAQSLQPREICVLDDGSTDESTRIIAEYAAQYPHILPVFLPENRGVIRNMMEWLARQTSEFVYFAAADDKTKPDFFERSLALLTTHPKAALCSGGCRVLGKEGEDLGRLPTDRPIAKSGYISPAHAARLMIRDDTWLIGTTTIYRRQALIDAGGFDEDLGGYCDGFAARILALRHGACFIPEDVAYWRRLGGGVSSQTIARPEVARRVAERVHCLVNGALKGLFPIGYSDVWRGRWYFGAATVAHASHRTIHDRWVALVALLSPKRLLHRMALVIVAAAPYPLARVLLFAAFRSRDANSVFRRRLEYSWLRQG